MSVIPRGVALAVTIQLMSAWPALAEGSREMREFNIVPQPPANALVDFALQAGISIDTEEAKSCGAKSAALVGRMSIDDGLAAMLAHTRCSFVKVSDAAYKIVEKQSAQQVRPPEIVVTATRQRTPIDRAPYSISMISGSDLARAGSGSIADLQSQISGLTVTNMGAGRDKVFIRGLSDGTFTGRAQSTVGLYFDEAPITYNAPDPDLKLFDIDQVEVLRGPQGTLYGAGSIGGVVHIVTNKPDISAFAFALEGSSAVTTGGDPSTDFAVMLNVPIAQNRLAMRIAGYREADGGYINDVRMGLSDTNKTSRDGVRLSARWQISNDWEMTVGGISQSIDLTDTQYEQAALGALLRANSVREPHDNNFKQASAVLSGTAHGIRLTVSAEYLNHDFDSRYDATEAAAFFGAAGAGPLAFDDFAHHETEVIEAIARASPSAWLSWLAGAFVSRDDETTSSVLRAIPNDANFYQENRLDHINEAALYAETTIKLSTNVSITGGFRGFSSALRTNSIVMATPAPARIFAGETKINDVAPKFVLAYQISDSVLVYAQAVEGYRLGGFNTAGPAGQVFAAASNGPQPDRTFRPDELWSYELGAKLSFFDGHLHLRSAAYYALWTNIQTDQFLPSGLPYTSNVGDGRDVGWELEANWAPSDNLSLAANFLLDSPELTTKNPGASSQVDIGLPGVPDVSAGMSIDYRHPLSRDLAALFSAQYAYVGSSQLTFQPSGALHMGGYSTERLSAGVEMGRSRLSLFADNPLNVRGNTFAFGNPFSAQRDVTPLRPRTIGLILSTHY